MEDKQIIRDYIAEHPDCSYLNILDAPEVADFGIKRIKSALQELEASGIIQSECETYRIRPGNQCYAEAVQDLTLNCYQAMYDRMPEPDSRIVLQEIRSWARRFEDWWWGLKESERDRRGYLETIDAFGDILIGKDLFITWESNLQEFTSKAFEPAVRNYLSVQKMLSREEVFTLVRGWAEEFWGRHYYGDPLELLASGRSYLSDVSDFFNAKIKEMQRNDS